MELKHLDLTIIDPHPANPRGSDLGDLSVLVANIQEFGFRSAVVVRNHPLVSGRYQLEAGHRRTAAAREAGLTEIPAFVIEDEDDATAVLALLAEQEAHVPFTDAQRAKGWQGVLALGDIDKAARVTGVDAEKLKAARRGRELVDKSKLEQATLDELAILTEFEGTEYLPRLEAEIGKMFDYTVRVIRGEIEKKEKIAAEEALAVRIGIAPAEFDRNVHMQITELDDAEGPMTVEKLAELIVERKLDASDVGYYIYEWSTPYVRYFLSREVLDGCGLTSRYERRETDLERAEREAKEAKRAGYVEQEKASEDIRHSWIVEHIRHRAMAPAILRVLEDSGYCESDYSGAKQRAIGKEPVDVLMTALALTADSVTVGYLSFGRSIDEDDAAILITWLCGLEETGYVLSPWEAERLEEARAVRIDALSKLTCETCKATEDECSCVGSDDPACADYKAYPADGGE